MKYVKRNDYDAELEKSRNTVGELLKSARIKKGLLQKDLKKALEKYNVNVTTGTVSKWEVGDATPSPYQLFALCYVLGIRNLMHYFTGEEVALYPELNSVGEQKVKQYVQDLIASGNYAPVQKKLNRYITLPLWDLPASAGRGMYLDNSSSEKVQFPASLVPDGADACIKISGDSMEPSFHDNQYVFVKECQTIEPGEIGIFILDSCSYIKMFDVVEPDEDEIDDYTDSEGSVYMKTMLVSLNKKYEPIPILPDSNFRVYAKVLS